MIRHVVLFRWQAQTPDAAKTAVVDGLRALPAQIPQILRYEFGGDAGLSEGNFDFAVVADFADEAGYRAYAAHPEHQRLIQERIRPHLAERVAVQYRID